MGGAEAVVKEINVVTRAGDYESLYDVVERVLGEHDLDICVTWPLSADKTVYGWRLVIGWGATDGVQYIWGKAEKMPDGRVYIWEEGRDELEEGDCPD